MAFIITNMVSNLIRKFIRIVQCGCLSSIHSFGSLCWYRLPTYCIPFATDASGWGCAACFHDEWFQRQWPPTWCNYHTNVREFVPIVLALEDWGHQSVVDVLSKSTFREPLMLSSLCKVMEFSLQQDVTVHAIHLPGKHNTMANSLSHFQAQERVLEDAQIGCLSTASYARDASFIVILRMLLSASLSPATKAVTALFL